MNAEPPHFLHAVSASAHVKWYFHGLDETVVIRMCFEWLVNYKTWERGSSQIKTILCFTHQHFLGVLIGLVTSCTIVGIIPLFIAAQCMCTCQCYYTHVQITMNTVNNRQPHGWPCNTNANLSRPSLWSGMRDSSATGRRRRSCRLRLTGRRERVLEVYCSSLPGSGDTETEVIFCAHAHFAAY